MSSSRLRFIRGHVDALRDLCDDMGKNSMPVKAVDLLKSKVDEAADSRDTGEYYQAGYQVTRSVASWISLITKSVVEAERRERGRGRGRTGSRPAPSRVQTRHRGKDDLS